MAFIQRIGTKPVQYQVDIILNKLQMNVKVENCDISVILKRGDHKSELQTPAPLVKTNAKFNKQQISVPTKLYWDEKKKEYLQKMGELQINIIHQKKVRCAGKIEFDIAQYATKNLYSVTETRQLQKCPDSNAKLYYEIRVHKFGDNSHYLNKDAEEDTKNKAKSNLTNARGRDVSPLNDTEGNMSGRQQISDIELFNARSKSPISKIDNKTVQFGMTSRNQDQNSNLNGGFNSARGNQFDESQLKSNLFSTNTKPDMKSNQPQFTTTYNSNIATTLPNQSNQFNEINGEKSFSKPLNLGNNSQLQSPNHIGGVQKQNELINQNQMRDLFKQQKEENISLKDRIQVVLRENDQLKKQVEDLKLENERLKSQKSTLESQNDTSFNGADKLKKAHQKQIISYEEKIKELSDKIDKYKAQSLNFGNSDLNDINGHFEPNQSELSQKFEKEKAQYEKKIEDLKQTVEEKDQKISELEINKGPSNRNNKEEQGNETVSNLQKQVKEQQQKLATLEKQYKQASKDLQQEKERSQKFESDVVDLRRVRAESDKELSQLDQLQKLKDENKKIKQELNEWQTKFNQVKAVNVSQQNKEGGDSKKQNQLQSQLDEAKQKEVKLTNEIIEVENQNKNLKSFIKGKENEIQMLQFQVSSVENRLKNTKENLCELLNLILMTGIKEFIDEADLYLNEPEEPQFVQQQSSSSQNQLNYNTNMNNFQNPNPFQFPHFTNSMVASQNNNNSYYSDKNSNY